MCATSLVLFFFSCKSGGNLQGSKRDLLVKKYSAVLDVSQSEIKNKKLYAFIEEWYGTKYKYGGVSKLGVDCSGFCNLLYDDVYHISIRRTVSGISKEVTTVKKEDLKEGDLLFFTISKKKNSHIGIYLKNNKFVHASSSKGVVISDLENPYYKNKLNKRGRLK